MFRDTINKPFAELRVQNFFALLFSHPKTSFEQAARRVLYLREITDVLLFDRTRFVKTDLRSLLRSLHPHLTMAGGGYRV